MLRRKFWFPWKNFQIWITIQGIHIKILRLTAYANLYAIPHVNSSVQITQWILKKNLENPTNNGRTWLLCGGLNGVFHFSFVFCVLDCWTQCLKLLVWIVFSFIQEFIYTHNVIIFWFIISRVKHIIFETH